jgi:LysR family transcriptional regulator, nitrogen assimilation regulatory protein
MYAVSAWIIPMDARRLRYFVAVAQLGSFSAAARRLHVAQPALSRHVKALEASLGVPLLVREPRGVKLTRDGEDFFAEGARALEMLDMLPRGIGQQNQRVAGRVVIGLPTSASAVVAVALLDAAFSRYPNVRVQLIESLSGYLREWIEAGRLDLAIVYDPPPNPGLRIDPILVEDLWLVGAPGTLPAGQEAVPFRDIAGYPLVIPGATHSHRRLVEGIARRRGVRLNLRAEVDSLTVQKAIVAAGHAHTILSHGAIQSELAAGQLQACRIVDPTVSRTVALAAAIASSDSQACNAMAKLTLEIAGGLVASGVWRGRIDEGIRPGS